MSQNRFTPELHLLLKRNLNANLQTLAGCSALEGRKLRFDPTTGLFAYDDSSNWDRFWRNLGSSGKDSAASRTMFEYPILITFYECRKLALKLDPQNPGSAKYAGKQQAYKARLTETPDVAMKKAEDGLTFLRDKTYDSWRKKEQRAAITAILEKVEQLRKAGSRQEIDRLICEWVPFALPAALRQLVVAAAQDRHVKKVIQRELKKSPGGSDRLVKDVADQIYYHHYKVGGSSADPSEAQCRHYLSMLRDIAAANKATAWPQGATKSLDAALADFDQRLPVPTSDPNKSFRFCRELGFIHFSSAAWRRAAGEGRVYVHVKADSYGSYAVNAVRTVFQSVGTAFPGGELAQNFCKFKVGNIRQIYCDTDSIVAWCKDLAAARKLANELARNLSPYVAPGLPGCVKPVAVGIGISTEPEYSFDRSYELAPHARNNYSFGGYRMEMIARGLIQAAQDNKGVLPGLDKCIDCVAAVFAGVYEVDPTKPYKPGSLWAPHPLQVFPGGLPVA